MDALGQVFRSFRRGKHQGSEQRDAFGIAVGLAAADADPARPGQQAATPSARDHLPATRLRGDDAPSVPRSSDIERQPSIVTRGLEHPSIASDFRGGPDRAMSVSVPAGGARARRGGAHSGSIGGGSGFRGARHGTRPLFARVTGSSALQGEGADVDYDAYDEEEGRGDWTEPRGRRMGGFKPGSSSSSSSGSSTTEGSAKNGGERGSVLRMREVTKSRASAAAAAAAAVGGGDLPGLLPDDRLGWNQRDLEAVDGADLIPSSTNKTSASGAGSRDSSQVTADLVPASLGVEDSPTQLLQPSASTARGQAESAASATALPASAALEASTSASASAAVASATASVTASEVSASASAAAPAPALALGQQEQGWQSQPWAVSLATLNPLLESTDQGPPWSLGPWVPLPTATSPPRDGLPPLPKSETSTSAIKPISQVHLPVAPTASPQAKSQAATPTPSLLSSPGLGRNCLQLQSAPLLSVAQRSPEGKPLDMPPLSYAPCLPDSESKAQLSGERSSVPSGTAGIRGSHSAGQPPAQVSLGVSEPAAPATLAESPHSFIGETAGRPILEGQTGLLVRRREGPLAGTAAAAAAAAAAAGAGASGEMRGPVSFSSARHHPDSDDKEESSSKVDRRQGEGQTTQRTSLSGNAVCGGLAGAVVSVCIHPIDTIKTLVQSQRGDASRSMGPLLNQLISERGVGGLYKGIAANLATSAPISAIYTSTYEGVKESLLPRLPPKWAPLAHCVAGACASVATSVVFTPSEAVKQRMQVTTQYPNSFAALLGMARSEGVVSLYGGLGAVLARNIPNSVIKFLVYESLKKHALQWQTERHLQRHQRTQQQRQRQRQKQKQAEQQQQGGQQQQQQPLLGGGADAETASSGSAAPKVSSSLSTLTQLLVGGAASCTAALTTTPLDVIKTRMQTQLAGLPQYFSVGDAFVRIVREEGVSGLYRGVAPRFLIYLSQGAIFFASYELLRRLLVLAPTAGAPVPLPKAPRVSARLLQQAGKDSVGDEVVGV